MNRFFRLTGLSLACFALSLGCSPREQGNITVVEKEANLNESLNLQAVGELARKAHNAQELEQMLNQEGGVNNLDLEHRGKVDYINVSEFNQGNQKGFKLTDRLSDGTTVDLATINFSPISGQTASMTVNGNQQYYPQNASYQTNVSLTDALILAWLFTPHPVFYHPYYYYGYYPSYYHYYTPVPHTVYTTRTYTTTTRTVPTSSSSTYNSTYTKPAPAKPSVVDPSASQKSFQARDTSKPVSSGGFGSPSPSKSLSAPPPAPAPKPRLSGSKTRFGKSR